MRDLAIGDEIEARHFTPDGEVWWPGKVTWVDRHSVCYELLDGSRLATLRRVGNVRYPLPQAE